MFQKWRPMWQRTCLESSKFSTATLLGILANASPNELYKSETSAVVSFIKSSSSSNHRIKLSSSTRHSILSSNSLVIIMQFKMQFIFSLFVSAAVLSTVSTVSATCDSKYSGSQAKLVQTGDKMNGTALNVDGTITIVDGCAFKVSNFTYLPGSDNTRWYGRVNGNFTVSFPVSDDVVPPTTNGSVDMSFNLNPSITWDQLDTLILYSLSDKLQAGYARFNFAQNLNSTTTSSTVAPTSTSTSSMPASTSMPSTTTAVTSATVTPHTGSSSGALHTYGNSGVWIMAILKIATMVALNVL